MPNQLRLGLTFSPALAPEALRSFARSAESSGLEDLWISEDCFKVSGVASTVTALGITERIRVGAAILPVPLRNVAQAAMEIATIDRLFPERFVAGIGHGVQPWMEQVAVRVDAPLTLLREYATALRRLLDGERVSAAGRYVQLDDVALDYPPLQPPPLLIGVAGPRSLVAAGELGTGTLLSLDQDLEAIEQSCRTTLTVAGPGHEVIASLPVATGPRARERVDAELAIWGMDGGPETGAAGDASHIADRMLRLKAAGVTAIGVVPCRDEPDLDAFAHFLGHEVRPLLS